MHLPVAPEREGVVALPGLSPASSGLVELVTLAETTGLLAGSGEATGLAVLSSALVFGLKFLFVETSLPCGREQRSS